ncbi:reverse transcriptase family protein [Micromonospora humida]|uniref:RNA-directed DNA polymerase n=1 Tax=Micromonospora humida TaxID=2809018 RepID=A0ABS2J2Y1_9ACTN|nr:reverse transcriptase family protein [Micromonospora humida]MBM7080915.1 RNA-directed DNA polymerase [Micromonospora humida]
MTYDSPHLYRKLGRERGVDDQVLDRAMRQISRLRAAGVTPVLTLNHLAHLTGAKYGYLRRIVARELDPYTEFTRQRRTGGKMRLISAPQPVLRDVQRWVLDRILHRIPVHPAAYAYVPGRSVAACARCHIGARYLLKFDLHDFFQSISEYRVFSVYRSLGYQPLISLELARLCTRDSAAVFGRRTLTAPQVERYQAIPAYRSGSLGFVPQGSPTSGAIANLVTRRLDTGLQRLAVSAGLTYTRYADDIVLGGSDAFDREHCRKLVREVRKIVRHNGFCLQEKKLRIIPPGARRIVLGVVLTDDGITISREVKDRLAKHLFGADRFGIHRHAEHYGFTSVFGFANHVTGLLAFAADIDPGYARPLIRQWQAIESRSGV